MKDNKKPRQVGEAVEFEGWGQGAKKEGREGSSPKVVLEAEEPLLCPEQPSAGTTPLFMALADNTYQSAVPGFCLLAQQGYHEAEGPCQSLCVVKPWPFVASGYL